MWYVSVYFSQNCTLLTKTEFDDFMQSGSQDWTCRICAESLFPFNHAVENEDFWIILDEFYNVSVLNNPAAMHKKIFNPFELNEDNEYIPGVDIDPDNLYYNDISYSMQSTYNYCSEDSFNELFQKNFQNIDTFSFFHMNVRSIPCNLKKLVQFLSNLDTRFDIIGVTETWLNESNKTFMISGDTLMYL